MTPPGEDDIGRDLAVLEAELKRLEAEYKMFFSGRLPRPPWETRSRVDALIKRLDRSGTGSYADRFRFNTLQSRFSSFIDLWDRGLRAREEGRGGPFAESRPAPQEKPKRPEDRIVREVRFDSSATDDDQIRELYKSVSEARRTAGQDAVSFDRFSQLVRTQMSSLRDKGTGDVAFRVAIKDGKVAFSARASKKPEGEKGDG